MTARTTAEPPPMEPEVAALAAALPAPESVALYEEIARGPAAVAPVASARAVRPTRCT